MKTLDQQIFISDAVRDPEWDQFVLNSPDGHYTQTALWSEAKIMQGWSPLRITIKENEDILAGAQVLSRSLPLVGLMGYISKGPICRTDDPLMIAKILEKIFKVCEDHRIMYMCIQPPDQGELIVQTLIEMGLAKSTQGDLEKPATIIIDLRPDEEGILAQIKPKRRRYFNHAEKHGFVFREGLQEDLCAFCTLHDQTGERDHFETQCEGFFQKLWEVFSPHGYIHLFVGEFEGEPVTSELAITFKDTFQGFRIGWSGKYSNMHPNEGMMRHTILWAKSHGYLNYDLGGIDKKTAIALRNGEPIPENIIGTYTEYKLRFSENVILYPETYQKVFNSALYWGFQKISSIPAANHLIKNAYKHMRKR